MYVFRCNEHFCFFFSVRQNIFSCTSAAEFTFQSAFFICVLISCMIIFNRKFANSTSTLANRGEKNFDRFHYWKLKKLVNCFFSLSLSFVLRGSRGIFFGMYLSVAQAFGGATIGANLNLIHEIGKKPIYPEYMQSYRPKIHWQKHKSVCVCSVWNLHPLWLQWTSRTQGFVFGRKKWQKLYDWNWNFVHSEW